jgi:ribosome silencing factor RsfS/YbeB/iojap
VLILDLRKLETMADFFVIATGEVDQQIRAIVKHIEDYVRVASGERVIHREGTETMNWVLLDYIDVVVHVFKPSFREFYRLEDLWSDADVEMVTDDKKIVPKPKPGRRRLAEVKPAATKSAASAKRETAEAAETKPKRVTKKAAPKAATKKKAAPAPSAKAAKPAAPARKKPVSRVPKILKETKPAARKPRARKSDS